MASFDDEITLVRDRTQTQVQALESELFGARWERRLAQGEAVAWRRTAYGMALIAAICALAVVF